MTVTETIALCKKILVEHYGAQFRGLLLYGSTARGQATPESDIDLLVLLDRLLSSTLSAGAWAFIAK